MTPDPTHAPGSRRPLRPQLGRVRGRAGLTLAGAVLLLLVGSANGLLLTWQSSVQHRITHTLSVDRTLMQVLADLLDSETGQRGYLLTGDPAFLVPYTAGQARIAAELPPPAAGSAAAIRACPAGVGHQGGRIPGPVVAALRGLAVEELGQHMHQGPVDRRGVGHAVLGAALPGQEQAIG
ncbi:hypothetical protein VQ03_30565, partial [Methylobacterium tarhaniae]